jgi:hypothetical protein
MIRAPISLKEANAYIVERHRHLKKVRGCLFCMKAVDDAGRMVGVIIAGRPNARALQDGFTAQITRCCTDGTPNACSFLYRAAHRALQAIGYRKTLNYTFPAEGGASMRAAGFLFDGYTKPQRWDRPSRRRGLSSPPVAKSRWVAGQCEHGLDVAEECIECDREIETVAAAARLHRNNQHAAIA